MTKFFTTERRKWLYNIAAAVLVILAGYGFVTAAESDNYLRLAEALLNTGGVVAVAVARNNLTPDKAEDTTEQRTPKHG